MPGEGEDTVMMEEGEEEAVPSDIEDINEMLITEHEQNDTDSRIRVRTPSLWDKKLIIKGFFVMSHHQHWQILISGACGLTCLLWMYWFCLLVSLVSHI